ncbi:MAG: bifunctional folylpolyglutamate synthase/dihydrofolate synthase [Chlamydiia bacterium]
MAEMLKRLGHPERMACIHVAGTNGKGSVCWKLAHALQAAGYRVGLHSSPHLCSIRERIRLSGEMISVPLWDACAREVERCCADLQPSLFEVLTAMSWLAFRMVQTDIAVVEVGLGGRLDATNLCTPLVTVITAIGLDHQAVLGADLETIAAEKAGIIKPGVPLVVGPEARQRSILEAAQRHRVPLLELLTWNDDYDVQNGMIAEMALQALPLEVPSEAVKSGLAMRPPCRCERIQVRHSDGRERIVILDVAHNPHGAQALQRKLKEQFSEPFEVVFGGSSDKDLDGVLGALKPLGDRLWAVQAEQDRAEPAQRLAERASERGWEATAFASVTEGVRRALQTGRPVLIVGSFFIMSEARQALGCHGEHDEQALYESPCKPR